MPTHSRLAKPRQNSASSTEVPHLLDPTYSGPSSSSPPKYSFSKTYVDSNGVEHDPDYKPFAVTTSARAAAAAARGTRRSQNRNRARSGSRVSQVALVRGQWDDFTDDTDDDDIPEEDDLDDAQELRERLMRKYGTTSFAQLPPDAIASVAHARTSRTSLYPSTPAQQQMEQQHLHSRAASPMVSDHTLRPTGGGSLPPRPTSSPIPPFSNSPLRQEFAAFDDKESEKKRFSWRYALTATPSRQSHNDLPVVVVVAEKEPSTAAKEIRSSAFATFNDSSRDVDLDMAEGEPEYVPSRHGQGRRIALPEGEVVADDDDHAWSPTCGEALRRQWQSLALSFRFATFRTKRRIKRRVASFGW